MNTMDDKYIKLRNLQFPDNSEFRELQHRLSEDLHYLNELSEDLLNLFDEIHKKQDELRLERNKYSSLFSYAPVGYISILGDGTIIEANRKIADLLGIDVDSMVGSIFYSIVNNDIKNEIVTFISNKGNQTKTLTLETELEVHDHKKTWVLIEICLNHDLDIKDNILHVSITDISKLKKYQNEIKISKEKIQQTNDFLNIVIETIPNPIFFTEPSGCITLCNKAFVDFCGKPRATIVGSYIHDLFEGTPDADIYIRRNDELLETRKTQIYEARFFSSDGSFRYVVVNKAVNCSPSKDVKGIVCIMIDITERIKYENQLKQSETKFKSLFICMIDSIILLEQDLNSENGIAYYNIIDVNPAFEKLLNTVAEKVIGLKLRDVLPGFKLRLFSMIDEIISNKESVRVEFYDEDFGKYFKVVVYFHQNNQLALILSDITQRKEIEKQLKERQVMLDSIVENIPFDFFALDKSMNYLYLNPVCAEKWHVSVGQNLYDIDVNIDNKQRWIDNNKRALRGEIVDEVVELIQDDEIRFVRNVIAPIKQSGRIVGVLGFNNDITEKQMAVSALEKSEDWFRQIVDFTLDMELFVDNQHKVVYINPAFERITGYTLTDYFSGAVKLVDIIHVDDLDFYHLLVEKSVGRETFYDQEFRMIKQTGEVIYVAASSQPVFGVESTFLGTRISIRDIDTRKQRELKMQKDIEKLHAKLAIYENTKNQK